VPTLKDGSLKGGRRSRKERDAATKGLRRKTGGRDMGGGEVQKRQKATPGTTPGRGGSRKSWEKTRTVKRGE